MVVKGPALPGKRVKLQRLSGQKVYPVIEVRKRLDLSRRVKGDGRDDPCRKARREAGRGQLARARAPVLGDAFSEPRARRECSAAARQCRRVPSRTRARLLGRGRGGRASGGCG